MEKLTVKTIQKFLGDQVHPMVQALFPEENVIFQDDNTLIHAARIIKEWHKKHFRDSSKKLISATIVSKRTEGYFN